MGPPSPQRHGEEEGFWECSSPSQGQRLMEFLGAVSCIPQLAPACSSLLQLALACSSLLQLAPACINLAALGFFSGVVTKEPSLQERHPQVFPPGTHLMSLLVGHLRPEPYPRLLHPPNPSVSKLQQSSAGQEGQRQFSFLSLLSVLWLRGA